MKNYCVPPLAHSLWRPTRWELEPIPGTVKLSDEEHDVVLLTGVKVILEESVVATTKEGLPVDFTYNLTIQGLSKDHDYDGCVVHACNAYEARDQALNALYKHLSRIDFKVIRTENEDERDDSKS